MPTTPLTPPTERKPRSQRTNPAACGLPDPRPVTEYTVELSTVGGHSRLTVNLQSPCVVRHPKWALIDCSDGSRVQASSVTVVSTTEFYFDYAGELEPMVAFVEVPYMDTNVQNFQGGFVRPGGQWFRAPQGPK